MTLIAIHYIFVLKNSVSFKKKYHLFCVDCVTVRTASDISGYQWQITPTHNFLLKIPENNSHCSSLIECLDKWRHLEDKEPNSSSDHTRQYNLTTTFLKNTWPQTKSAWWSIKHKTPLEHLSSFSKPAHSKLCSWGIQFHSTFL